MNKVLLCGRIATDISYRENGDKISTRFSLAINRGKDKNGQELGAYFIPIMAYGKIAENIKKFTCKGKKVLIEGHMQSGRYEKDEKTYYSLNCTVDKIDFLEWKDKVETKEKIEDMDLPDGFENIGEDDIPF